MSNIKSHCDILQNHIKKSKSNLKVFMYNTDGIMFMLLQPFVNLHKKHFNKVEEYVKILNDYSKANNLNIELETFSEFENSAVMYSEGQLGALTSKQYQWRIKYLDNLNDKIEALKKCC